MDENVFISFLLLQGAQSCLGYKSQFLGTSKPIAFASVGLLCKVD